MSKQIKKIVCLGGGTGVSVVLSGFKKYPLDLTAIITMFDSGGSSGKLRKELGILPLGDIRQCLVALSNETNLTNLFHYRFGKGTLKGHNFGNLLIAAAIEATGGLNKAIDKISKILNIKDKVVPVTLDRADIIAILKNNKKIKEEEEIINCPYLSKVGVKKLFLEPKVKVNPKAISAIKNADLIIITPGKFYTSIIPNFLVKGISAAIRKSRAKKVFVCNLMTQIGNTDGFSVVDFLTILEKYLGKDIIDYVIFNTGKLSANQIKEVRKIFPKADFIKYDKSLLKRTPILPPPSRKRAPKFIGADVIDRQIRKLNPADILVKGANKRTMILHEPNKLAKVIINLCKR
ncbi:MAG: YvcK family protein [Candidatus Nealsonbacteria bacterium]|nr:MAG: YvcK family protein [Candidatus Nealsonbacteria bacterium]